jgi:hypothetical protein
MWIEIFRSGKHMSSNGITKEYTPEDIQLIEKKYNEKTEEDTSFEAPLVKGHPKNDAPAYGWVEKLARKGDKLLAKIKDTEKSIIDDVRNGRFKKISVALYPDMMLRHVGLLGAATPAVKGLKSVSFNDNSEYHEFSDEIPNYSTNAGLFENEIERLKMENRELKEQINEFRKKSRMAEFQEFTNELNNSDKFISPAQYDMLKNIFEDIYTFSGDKSDEIIGSIKEFIRELDTRDLVGTIEQRSLFKSNNDIHTKAMQFRRENPEITYEEAVLKAHSFFY